MNAKKMLISVLLILCSFLVMAWFLFRPFFFPQSVENGKKSAFTKGYDEFGGVRIEAPGNDRQSYWEIEMEKLFRDHSGEGRMQKVTARYFMDRKLIYEIVAPTGKIFWETRLIHFDGSVYLKGSDGRELYAKTLIWDQSAGEITAQTDVKFRSGQMEINTGELTADYQFNRVVSGGLTRMTYRR